MCILKRCLYSVPIVALHSKCTRVLPSENFCHYRYCTKGTNFFSFLTASQPLCRPYTLRQTLVMSVWGGWGGWEWERETGGGPAAHILNFYFFKFAAHVCAWNYGDVSAWGVCVRVRVCVCVCVCVCDIETTHTQHTHTTHNTHTHTHTHNTLKYICLWICMYLCICI